MNDKLFGSSMGWFMGMRVVEAQSRPRYVLPPDVPPPPGMTRDEFAAWSARVCGVVSAVPPGQALVMASVNTIVMHPRDLVLLQNIA